MCTHVHAFPHMHAEKLSPATLLHAAPCVLYYPAHQLPHWYKLVFFTFFCGEQAHV